MHTLTRYFLAGSVLASFHLGSVQADDAVLINETFKDQDASRNPAWKPMKNAEPWLVAEGAVVPGGTVIFDTLETQDFPPITNGAFDLTLKVRFESSLRDGNNRFFLRMRDSNSDRGGYEVVISQGTSNNVLLGAIGAGDAISQKVESTPFVFPTEDFVPVRWVRDAQGAMKVWVAGDEYLSGTDTGFQTFDVLALGSRSYISEGANQPSGMRHFFSDIVLRQGPASLADLKD
jgi:hypothetical protein